MKKQSGLKSKNTKIREIIEDSIDNLNEGIDMINTKSKQLQENRKDFLIIDKRFKRILNRSPELRAIVINAIFESNDRADGLMITRESKP